MERIEWICSAYSCGLDARNPTIEKKERKDV